MASHSVKTSNDEELEDLVARFNSLTTDEVPAQCLLVADWLDERGANGNGWRTLGILGLSPDRVGNVWFWWAVTHPPYRNGNDLGNRWSKAIVKDGTGFSKVSSALSAAATAYLTLSDVVQREILSRPERALPHKGKHRRKREERREREEWEDDE